MHWYTVDVLLYTIQMSPAPANLGHRGTQRRTLWALPAVMNSKLAPRCHCLQAQQRALSAARSLSSVGLLSAVLPEAPSSCPIECLLELPAKVRLVLQEQAESRLLC